MQIHQIILLSLQIMSVISKKYVSSSDESIENLLYFKDCQKKGSSTPPTFERLQAPPKPKAMDCPFPKMCCSITCGGNECGSSTSPFISPQDSMGAEQVFPPIKPYASLQPQGSPGMTRVRKKKTKQPMRLPMPPMLNGRRDFGFTKDRIKSLINQDDDIRKILKDLVRVTMQKVDLVEMINTRRQAVSPSPSPTPKNVNDDEDDDELE